MNQSQLGSVAQIGNSFVQLYYQKIGQERDVAQLKGLYFANAEIVWNSQPFSGPEEFGGFVQSMPEFRFKVTSTDSLPIVVGTAAVGSAEPSQLAGVLVVANGFVVGHGEMTPFTHTFQLFPDAAKGSNAYAIKLDRFCIV